VKRTLTTAAALLLAATFLPAHEPAAVDLEGAKRAIRIADLEIIPIPSPFLSSRAKRGICVPLD
jgi:hypothetical protein